MTWAAWRTRSPLTTRSNPDKYENTGARCYAPGSCLSDGAYRSGGRVVQQRTAAADAVGALIAVGHCQRVPVCPLRGGQCHMRHPAARRYTGQRRQQGRGNGFALVAGQLHQNIRGNILPPHGGVRAVRRKVPQLPAGRCRGACFTLDQEIPPVRRPLQTDDGDDPLIQRLPRPLLAGATPAVWAAGILYIQRCI